MSIENYFIWIPLLIAILYAAWTISGNNDRGKATKIGYDSLRYLANNVPRTFIALIFLIFEIYVFYLLLSEPLSADAQVNTYIATISAFILVLKYFKDTNKYYDAPKIEQDNKKLEEANYDLLTILLSIAATAIGFFLAYNS